MKLFLSSTTISPHQSNAFCSLAGKPPGAIRLALIENAADPYPKEVCGFVRVARQEMKALGLQITLFDLSAYGNRIDLLFQALQGFDAIWCGGGNTFYLRWLMRETGFDRIIEELLAKGIVYGGGSAGAVVACPDLKFLDLVDDPKDAPQVIWEGLNLVQDYLIPHWGEPELQPQLDLIKKNRVSRGQKVITLTDNQAFMIDGQTQRIL